MSSNFEKFRNRRKHPEKQRQRKKSINDHRVGSGKTRRTLNDDEPRKNFNESQASNWSSSCYC